MKQINKSVALEFVGVFCLTTIGLACLIFYHIFNRWHDFSGWGNISATFGAWLLYIDAKYSKTLKEDLYLHKNPKIREILLIISIDKKGLSQEERKEALLKVLPELVGLLGIFWARNKALPWGFGFILIGSLLNYFF